MSRNMKDWCSQLGQNFEEIVSRQEKCCEDIDQETAERSAIEKQIKALTEKFEKKDKKLTSHTTKRDKLSRKLDDLGKVDPAKAAKMMARMRNADGHVKELRAEMLDAAQKASASGDQGVALAGHSGEADEVVTSNLVVKGDKFGGANVPARRYKPPQDVSTPGAGAPLIVFFHGGGFVAGDLETHDWLCRTLSALAGVEVVAVHYRRAPEFRFPAAFDDAYAALCWIAAGGLGGPKPTKLAVAGDEAGGGLAAACCIKARDDTDASAPHIALQLLIYPWLDLREESLAKAAANSGDQRDELEWFRDTYGEKKANPEDEPDYTWCSDPRVSALCAASAAALPQAFIAYLTDDILGAGATDFAARLRAEKGRTAVHLLRFRGVSHGFARDRGRPEAHAAVAAAAAFAAAVLCAEEPSAGGWPPSAVAKGIDGVT